jgi:transcriptional regulator with XRE-family HTH domain
MRYYLHSTSTGVKDLCCVKRDSVGDVSDIVRRNILKFRKEAGLTQEQLAAAVGVSVDAVRSWKTKTPSTETMRSLSLALGRPFEHFYLEAPPPMPNAKRPVFALKYLGADDELGREIKGRAETAISQLQDEYFERRRAALALPANRLGKRTEPPPADPPAKTKT